MILVIMLLFVLLFMPSKPNTNHFKKNEVNNSNNNKNKKIEKGVYKLLLKYTRLELNKFIIAFVVMILAVGMNLITPLLLGDAVTILSKEVIDIKKIIIIIVLYIIILIIACIIQYYQSIILAKAGDKIIYQMREDVFTKLEGLSIHQLNETPVGKLVTRVTSDTNALNDMYTSTIVNLIKNVLTIVGVIVSMFLINVKLTLWVLITTPIVGILSYIFRKLARKIYRKVRHGITSVNTSLSENISGVKLTQIFNQEQKQIQSFKKVNDDLEKSYSKQILLFGIFRPSIYAVYVLTIVLLFYVAGKDIIDSNFVLESGLIVIFYSYIEKLFTPIQNLA